MLWRCQMHGLVPPGADPAEVRVSEVVAPLTTDVPFTFVGVHVALGLATAEDADGLRRFAASAAGFAAPGSAELLPDVALGLASYVEGDHAAASDRLLARERDFVRFGGSHAQREVFEDTLIQALIRAGRLTEASTRSAGAAGPAREPAGRGAAGPHPRFGGRRSPPASLGR